DLVDERQLGGRWREPEIADVAAGSKAGRDGRGDRLVEVGEALRARRGGRRRADVCLQVRTAGSQRDEEADLLDGSLERPVGRRPMLEGAKRLSSVVRVRDRPQTEDAGHD